MPHDVIDEMLDKKKWAVLGASPKKEKIANRIVHRLKNKGYEVYCINPNYQEGEGMPYYNCIADLPEKPDVIDFVVPPGIAKKAIESLDPNDVSCLWFQPGSYDKNVVDYAKEKGFKVVSDGSCVMVELAKK